MRLSTSVCASSKLLFGNPQEQLRNLFVIYLTLSSFCGLFITDRVHALLIMSHHWMMHIERNEPKTGTSGCGTQGLKISPTTFEEDRCNSRYCFSHPALQNGDPFNHSNTDVPMDNYENVTHDNGRQCIHLADDTSGVWVGNALVGAQSVTIVVIL